MPPVVVVRSADASVRAKRDTMARRVITAFGATLPDLKLLCFFDDQDWTPFKEAFGAANRGFHVPIQPGVFSDVKWPEYVRRHILADDPTSSIFKRVFDHCTYLYGSTCTDEVGQVMTFAHELQHFVQYSGVVELWAAGWVLLRLSAVNDLGLKWADIPHEREARIVAKRIAQSLFDPERVKEFISRKIADPVNPNDQADWEFIQAIETSATYDLMAETRCLFQRLQSYRDECDQLLKKNMPHVSELKHVDLDKLFNVT
jgi:hypothetical protein